MSGSLTLKWGTIKGWDSLSADAVALLQQYADLGWSMGAAQQRDTPEQKRLICELIDAVDEPIFNDWSGDDMTRQEAKDYVMSYGRAAEQADG